MKLQWAIILVVGAAFLASVSTQVMGQGGFSPAVASAIPQYMSYQGRLTDATGKPLPDKEYTLTVRVCDDPAAGGILWYDIIGVETVDGVFKVDLNCGQLAWDRPYWIELVCEGQTLTPRTPIASVGYAFKAADAYTVGGYAPSTVPQAGSLLVLDSQGKMPGSAIANGTIGVSQLGANAVTSAKIAPGAVEMTDIKNGAVGGDQLALGSVKQSHLTGECVGEGQLIPQSVTEGKLGDGAVTLAKLGANSVSGAKIQPGAVDGTKIAAGAVDSAQIKAGAVDSAQIKDGAVGAAQIKDGAVGAAQIADGSVGSAEVGSRAVGAEQLRVAFRVASVNFTEGERDYMVDVDPTAKYSIILDYWLEAGGWERVVSVKGVGSYASGTNRLHMRINATGPGTFGIYYLALQP